MERVGHQLTKDSKKTLLTVTLGALLGLVGLLVTAMLLQSVRLQFFSHPFPIFADSLSPHLFGVYVGLGGITIGGLIAFFSVRYQTGVPAIVATLVYLLAVSWTWWQVHTWEQPSIQESIPPLLPWVTVLEYILLGWPLLLGLALGSGIIEYRRRSAKSVETPPNMT